jgi:hypothetical protein
MSATETSGTDLANEGFGASTVNERARNLFGQIGDAIQESKRDQHLDLAIPGTNEMLWARYRPFPVAKTEAKTEEMRRAVERGRPVMLAAACDTLVDACEQIYVLPPEFEGDAGEDGENLIPIDDTIPVRFEKRLVDLFLKPKGVDTSHVKTARDVVLSMFPTEQSIIASNVEVSTWMNSINRRTHQEAVGE